MLCDSELLLYPNTGVRFYFQLIQYKRLKNLHSFKMMSSTVHKAISMVMVTFLFNVLFWCNSLLMLDSYKMLNTFSIVAVPNTQIMCFCTEYRSYSSSKSYKHLQNCEKNMTLLYIFSKKTADTLMYIPTLCESKEKSLHLLFGLWVWLSNTDSKTSVRRVCEKAPWCGCSAFRHRHRNI